MRALYFLRGPAGFAVQLIGGLAALSATVTPAKIVTPTGLFQGTNVLQISIDIPAEGMKKLRVESRPAMAGSKPRAAAVVTEGGRRYTNVAVQLKGFTTFQPIDGLPSLTLIFDQLAPGQQFHGLSKISLNNSLQDPTRLQEKLSRELFAAAGVPVARADYASVTLNGRRLGLFVLAEGYDKKFLQRYFTRTDGNLYDGGTLRDIDAPLRVTSGRHPTNHSGLQRLLAAAREPDLTGRFLAVESALDLERFLSMMAMETMLCHSDSYSMNRNNYRVYHDPQTDKMVFMPHGMDRVLGSHRSALDLSLVPPTWGVVARAILSTPEGRRRYLERAQVLFTNYFQPESLCRRLHEMSERIAPELMKSSIDQRFSGFSPANVSQNVERLCANISARAADLALQFAQVSDLAAPVPFPEFGPEGTAHLGPWYPRRRVAQSEIACDTEIRNGAPVLHLRARGGVINVSVRTRLNLTPGVYRLAGEIKLAGPDPAGPLPLVGASIRRSYGDRFNIQTERFDSRRPDFPFTVSRGPEEIEVIYDIRASSGELWFDPNGLQLTRQAH